MKIFTVIPYFYNGVDVNLNDVKSFYNRIFAMSYGESLKCSYDVTESIL